jgi:hypothetical protein
VGTGGKWPLWFKEVFIGTSIKLTIDSQRTVKKKSETK